MDVNDQDWAGQSFPSHPYPAGGETISAAEVMELRRQRGKPGPISVVRGGAQRDRLVAVRTDGDVVPAFQPPAYPGDCGLDLALSDDVVIEPGGTVNVGTGVAVALPPGTFGWITGRSSTWTRLGLIVMAGIIDEGWRGELRVLLYRPPTRDYIGHRLDDWITLKARTRVAQLIVLPNLLRQVEVHHLPPGHSLPPGDRGEAGFGSTGN